MRPSTDRQRFHQDNEAQVLDPDECLSNPDFIRGLNAWIRSKIQGIAVKIPGPKNRAPNSWEDISQELLVRILSNEIQTIGDLRKMTFLLISGTLREGSSLQGDRSARDDVVIRHSGQNAEAEERSDQKKLETFIGVIKTGFLTLDLFASDYFMVRFVEREGQFIQTPSAAITDNAGRPAPKHPFWLDETISQHFKKCLGIKALDSIDDVDFIEILSLLHTALRHISELDPQHGDKLTAQVFNDLSPCAISQDVTHEFIQAEEPSEEELYPNRYQKLKKILEALMRPSPSGKRDATTDGKPVGLSSAVVPQEFMDTRRSFSKDHLIVQANFAEIIDQFLGTAGVDLEGLNSKNPDRNLTINFSENGQEISGLTWRRFMALCFTCMTGKEAREVERHYGFCIANMKRWYTEQQMPDRHELLKAMNSAENAGLSAVQSVIIDHFQAIISAFLAEGKISIKEIKNKKPVPNTQITITTSVGTFSITWGAFLDNAFKLLTDGDRDDAKKYRSFIIQLLQEWAGMGVMPEKSEVQARYLKFKGSVDGDKTGLELKRKILPIYGKAIIDQFLDEYGLDIGSISTSRPSADAKITFKCAEGSFEMSWSWFWRASYMIIMGSGTADAFKNSLVALEALRIWHRTGEMPERETIDVLRTQFQKLRYLEENRLVIFDRDFMKIVRQFLDENGLTIDQINTTHPNPGYQIQFPCEGTILPITWQLFLRCCWKLANPDKDILDARCDYRHVQQRYCEQANNVNLQSPSHTS